MDAEAANDLVNSLPNRLTNSNNHDELRAEMLREGITGNEVTGAFVAYDLDHRNSKKTWNDVLDHPFFVIDGLGSGSVHQLSQHQSLHMSHDLSTAARSDLANFLGFDVHFADWIAFDQDTQTNLQVANQQAPAYLLARFLSDTYSSRINTDHEASEFAKLQDSLNMITVCFGYELNITGGSAEDAQLIRLDGESEEKIIACVEVKQAALVPLFVDIAADLALFGFATHVAKTPCENESRDRQELRRNLFRSLGFRGEFIRDDNPQKNSSSMTEKMLERKAPYAKGLDLVIGNVTRLLQESKLRPTDCVGLWGAIMQACMYSVFNKKTVSVVVSARTFWFLRLTCDKDGKCTVQISQGLSVGRPGFLRGLIQFCVFAAGQPEMSRLAQRHWQIALALPTYGGVGESLGREQAGEEKDLRGGSAAEYDAGGTRGSESNTSRGESLPAVETAQAHDFLDMDVPLAVGDNGVVVPWLDQIGPSLSVLGMGRSGEVTVREWNNQRVAVKVFCLRGADEDRIVDDVYMHELEVLTSLQSLWGKFVPRLLFQQPWKTSPMIGMQLGEPLPDDFDEWSEEDIKLRDMAVEAVEELGWEQRDFRGANFVRLVNGSDEPPSIAMVDFESFEKPYSSC